jgi:hypothetical protein
LARCAPIDAEVETKFCDFDVAETGAAIAWLRG